MFNKILMCGDGGMGSWNLNVDYRDFKLGRHSSGMGTVLHYMDLTGKEKDILVLDAAYRSDEVPGLAGFDVPELNDPDIVSIDKATRNIIGEYGSNNNLSNSLKMPDRVTNEAIRTFWKKYLSADKSARENSDILLKYHSYIDSNGVVGVPLVAACRRIKINGFACDLPNIYQTMIIWGCGDILDELDPTASTNVKFDLCGTAYSSSNHRVRRTLCSSTENDTNSFYGVYWSGYCARYGSKIANTVGVPILELN